MSAVLQPFGLLPDYSVSGIDRNTRFNATTYSGTVTKFYNVATTFYQGMPLTISAAGVVDVITSPGAGTAATGTNQQFVAVFWGAEYTTSTGERRNTKYYVDGLATTTGDPNVWFWLVGWQDPNIIYNIQANGSLSASAIGGQFNFNNPGQGIVIGAGGGSGFSTCSISTTEVATGAQGQVRVLGLGRTVAYPSNTPNMWGDAYTIVQVQPAFTSFAAAKPNLS